MKPRYSSLHRAAAWGYDFRKGDLRPGFTAVEIASAIAILAAIAAVSVPLAAYRDERKVDSTSAMLSELKDGLTSPSSGFRRAVGANAGQLSELTAQIWNDGSGSPPVNSCGRPFSNFEVNNWDDAGPYVGFFIPTTGLETPIGLAKDRLVRVAERGDSASLRVVIQGVRASHARMLDRRADGSTGSEDGAVRWNSQTESDDVTLLYVIPIDGRC